MARDKSYRGYSAVGKEKVRGTVCVKEGFDVRNPDEEKEGEGRFWPDAEMGEGFREELEGFFELLIFPPLFT